MLTEWTGTAWNGVVLATHESNRMGPILIVVALILFVTLTVIAVFLRREGRERRKRKQQEQAQRAAPDQPGGS